jgi:hypothetical protein
MSAFEHAWTSATHDLVYKSSQIDWQRLRLASQMKALVEQLDTLLLSFDDTARAIVECESKDISSKKMVAERVSGLIASGLIPKDAAPKDISRFSDNVVSMFRKQHKLGRLDDCLTALESYLQNQSPNLFPRSCTLIQIVLATALEKDLLRSDFGDYRCHITKESTDVFPILTGVTPVFDYLT